MTELRVGPIEPGDAEEWASAVLRGNEAPIDGVARMLAAGAAHPNFRAYAAWDGDEMVAAAGLFVHGYVASLNSAGTVPGHRGQGAQEEPLARQPGERRPAPSLPPAQLALARPQS